MFDFGPFSPPGSPCSSSNDVGVLGSASPTLGFGPAQAPADPSLQSFFSSYSSLCDWAGGNTGMAMPDGDGNHDNTKIVLPPLSPSYGCIGEVDHPLSFSSLDVVVDPWNNVQDMVVRPLFGGLEDTWAGTRLVASTTAPYG